MFWLDLFFGNNIGWYWPGSSLGFRNWVPKSGNDKILGHQERPQYTQITTINMYLLNRIKAYFQYTMPWELN